MESRKPRLDPASPPPGAVCDDPEATSHATTGANKKKKIGQAPLLPHQPVQEWTMEGEYSKNSASPPPGACDDPKAKTSSPDKTATDSNKIKNGGGRKNRAPPLSIDNIVSALKSLTDQWRHVGEWLRIPDTALEIIASESSTPGQCLKGVVRYWLMKDPLASWRRLIHLLDLEKNFHGVTNTIRCNAEKLQDPTLTSSTVLAALQTVENVEDVRWILETPFDMYYRLKSLHDNTSLRTALVDYYLQNFPVASWEHLAGDCLFLEKDSALQGVKAWIRPEKDSTLTTSRLAHLLKDVDWNVVRLWLHIPKSVYNAITEQAPSKTEALCEWYVGNHPAPSWSHVADALYCSKQHEALEVLRDEVPSLKGSKWSRDLFSNAMKLGHIDANIGKMLVYGACGTGKSSFIEIMTGNSPDPVRRSTPLATRPVAMFQLDIRDKKWAKLSARERKEFLIKATTHLLAQQEEASGPEGDEQHGQVDTSDTKQKEQLHVPVSSEGQSVPTTSTQDTQPRVHSVALPPTTTARQEEQTMLKTISFCDDLVSLMQECTITGQAITSYRKILMIDSGGQPQFHEILPVFMRRMSLYVFVFKLSEELDSYPTVEYYDQRGEPIGKSYKAAHTNYQLLQHCLRTLHTHRTSIKDKETLSRIMVVGTHRDKESQSFETREEKEKKLLKLLVPEFRTDTLYYSAHPRKVIFPVNAKEPQPEDRALIEEIQHLVTTECNPTPVKVPLQYFALEIVLEEASEKLERGIFSIEECLELAAELHFDKDTLDAALQFLDELSVLFYFPEVLEGVVFVSTQVLLDKATELVKKMYNLLEDGSRESSAGEWGTFIENACFDLKFLSRPDFSKHYLSNLFTPAELVKLFKRLLIFADFPNPKPTPSPRTDMFFMPALLKVLKEDEISKFYVPSNSAAAPLALDFPLGGPRLGVFCALICFLVSKSNRFPGPWEVEVDSDEVPVCLFRNCIQLCVPEYPCSITLIDTFSQFQIHVEMESDECQELCFMIRQAIVSGLKTTTITLGYTNCTPSLAFVCPCKVVPAHIAKLRGKSWYCGKNWRKNAEADDRFLIWNDKKVSSCMPPTLTQLTGQDFTGIMEKLRPHCSRWRRIGENLGFSPAELSAIESAPKNFSDAPGSYLSAMLSDWLQWAPGDGRGSRDYATLQALRTAVDSAGLGRTAQEL